MLARANLMLAFLLVICALGLVTSQHRARKLFIDLERAQTHATEHEVRWNQLQVEQTELAKASRIDARARRELGMQAVPADRTLHLSVDPVSRKVSLSQPWLEPPAGIRAAIAGPGAAVGARASDPRRADPGKPQRAADGGVPVKGVRR